MKTPKNTKTKMLWASLALSGGLIAVAPSAFADRSSARTTAYRMADRLREIGWGFRGEYEMGFLEERQKEVSRTTLYEGNTYALIAGGCDEARDVDLEVYDENWNLVGKDSDSSDLALVKVTPRWTGTFYTVVRMYDSTPGGAHYVLVTGHD